MGVSSTVHGAQLEVHANFDQINIGYNGVSHYKVGSPTSLGLFHFAFLVMVPIYINFELLKNS